VGGVGSAGEWPVPWKIFASLDPAFPKSAMFLYLPNECGRVAASSKLEPEAELHDPLGSLGGCENLAPATQATYVHQVSMFARYLGRLPEMLGPEEIRSYHVYLAAAKKLAPSSISTAVAALQSIQNLQRDFQRSGATDLIQCAQPSETGCQYLSRLSEIRIPQITWWVIEIRMI